MTLPEWNFGPYWLDPADARLMRDGETLPLRPKAFAVLCHLVEHSGRLVDKDELLNAVWPRGYVSDSVVEVCINQLRKVLEDDRRSPRYIETVPKRGYRFIGEFTTRCAVPGDFGDQRPCGHTPLGGSENWVGREVSLARLHSLWAETLAGERRIVFLTGDAGIGKTTLIEMLLRDLGAEPVPPPVLWGQCIDHFGAGEAFLPLLSALGGHVPYCKAILRSGAPTWLAQLPGAVTPEERAGLQQEVIGATRERMLREGCELLEALSSRMPLVLVLEDLHWSDNATLELLSLLGRRRGRAPLLVIGSYRPGDAALRDHPVKQVQQELESHRLCAELALDTWRFEEVQDYLAKRFPEQAPPEPVAHLLHRRSGGHPLFLVNLLDYLLARGQLQPLPNGWRISGGDTLETQVPDDVRQMIRHQVSRLAPEEQRLLQVASAAGVESSAALLASALDRDVVEVEAVCEGLARRGVILANTGTAEWPDGTVAGRYAFRHALYAEVMYQELAPAYRQASHRCLSERLERAYGQHVNQIAPELARHFEAGRSPPQAVHYLTVAAEQSARRYANREALNYLNRALGWIDRLPTDSRLDARIDLLQRRARIAWALTDWATVLSDLETVLALARDESRIEAEVVVLQQLVLAYAFCDQELCVRTMENAYARSLLVPNEPLKAHVLSQQAYLQLEYSEWTTESRANFRRASVSIGDIEDGQGLWRLWHYRGMESVLCLTEGDHASAFASAEDMVRLALKQGDGFNYICGEYMRTWPLLYLGHWGWLRQILTEGLRASEQNGSPFSLTAFRMVKAALHLELSDFEGARELCEHAPLRDGDLYVLTLYRLNLARAYLGLGRLAEAKRCFQAISDDLESRSSIELRNRLMFHENFGTYWLAAGYPGKARGEAEQLLSLGGPPGNRHFLALGHRLLALSAMVEGKLEDAAMQIEAALALIENDQVPLAAWRVHATAAELQDHLEDRAKAQRHRTQAARIVETLAAALGDDEEGRRLGQRLMNTLPSDAPESLSMPS